MPVDMLHTAIGATYLLLWMLIGQVAIRRKAKDSESTKSMGRTSSRGSLSP